MAKTNGEESHVLLTEQDAVVIREACHTFGAGKNSTPVLRNFGMTVKRGTMLVQYLHNAICNIDETLLEFHWYSLFKSILLTSKIL